MGIGKLYKKHLYIFLMFTSALQHLYNTTFKNYLIPNSLHSNTWPSSLFFSIISNMHGTAKEYRVVLMKMVNRLVHMWHSYTSQVE